METKSKETSMPVVNFHAAGIDVGSKSHFVAVGQSEKDVREFDVNTKGHKLAIEFLKEHQITSVVMESTGSYWQSLFTVLQQADFKVLLVSGNQAKNSRKKTDVQDCQWLQKLHTMGLLTSCFLPGEQTLKLRNLSRHRSSLVESCAQYTNKIQKALRLMNIRLDVAIRDIVGKSGRAIIESILAGQRDANILAQLTDARVKKSKEEIALLLQGQWDDQLLYELKDCYELLDIYNQKIENVDKQIEMLLNEQTKEITITPDITCVKKQQKGKHSCKANLSILSYKTLGVDLMGINGIGPGTVLNFISEMGLDIHKFESAKHFTSWLRLAPNNKKTGGKIFSSRTGKTKNILTKALKDAANAIGLSTKDDYLVHFFKKIAFKKGRGAAITATARKLATIIWNMITKQQSYQPIKSDEYLKQLRQRKIKFLKRTIAKNGITINELSMA